MNPHETGKDLSKPNRMRLGNLLELAEELLHQSPLLYLETFHNWKLPLNGFSNPLDSAKLHHLASICSMLHLDSPTSPWALPGPNTINHSLHLFQSSISRAMRSTRSPDWTQFPKFLILHAQPLVATPSSGTQICSPTGIMASSAALKTPSSTPNGGLAVGGDRTGALKT
jgi:hypothetical protein